MSFFYGFYCLTQTTMFPIKDKRKASVDDLGQQPPVKKVANDGTIVAPSNNWLPTDMHVEKNVPASVPAMPDAGPSSLLQILSESKNGNTERKGRDENETLRLRALLNQAWKDDLKSGQLLVSLSELFGERIFPFIPSPELSLFL